MVAYAKSQQRKKEESERLTGERDQIQLIDLRFESRQVVGFRKAPRGQDVSQVACSLKMLRIFLPLLDPR